jgi:rubrerythrin
MSKTAENLELLPGESQASMRYLAFAEKADKDGYPEVAKFFRAAAKAELFHALSHLRASGLVQGTRDNLQSALEGETYESKKMYPPRVQAAVAEKEMEARHSFEYAMSIEMIHAKFFKDPCPARRNNIKTYLVEKFVGEWSYRVF